MRFSIEVAGHVFALDLSTQCAHDDYEPGPQGSTSGALERSVGWDHDTKEPVVGFATTRRSADG